MPKFAVILDNDQILYITRPTAIGARKAVEYKIETNRSSRTVSEVRLVSGRER